MNDNLAPRVKQAEKDILSFKATQATQNDSYMFYAYQSPNLYNRYPSLTTLHLEFRPYNVPSENVVCKFYAEEGLAVQYIANVEPDVSNPLKATFEFYGWSGSTPPSFMQFCYIGCIANCRGDLIIT